MNSPVVSLALPLALAVIMFGLGLSLSVDDFTRTARQPRTVVIALVCQLLVLPVIAFGLVLLFDLPPTLAVGMLLLAASPGGTTANLLSHLFGGDVALNVSLTAVNSIIAVITAPLITNFAIDYFHPEAGASGLGLQFGKVVQVFAMILIPVIIGMLVRRLSADFADRMDRPVRIGSALILVLVIAASVIGGAADLPGYLLDVGAVTLIFCLLSLTVGYFVPRWCGVDIGQAIACSMEIGIHNSAIAITIAISVLDSTEISVPAGVYGGIMLPVAGAVGWLITRRHAGVRTAEGDSLSRRLRR
ncbi:bile acid:sodium symporter family protein [Nocardia sp. NPDC050630]|uniref:bile acid:sodium symporter family protein n=1 Tax=Nocardia sp. NPDC050630 TaxID=3364321 RepID=UPI0037AB8D01